MESNPEPFKPHYCQLLQLFNTVLQDHNNPTALYYCILTLTAITAYTGTEEMVRQHYCFSFDIWQFQFGQGTIIFGSALPSDTLRLSLVLRFALYLKHNYFEHVDTFLMSVCHFASPQHQMRSIIPSLIVALKHLIKADQVSFNM